MQPQTILLVGADQPHIARLRAALTTSPALRLAGDVRHSAEAAGEAARLRPAAIVLAADLPGRLLVPLVQDLHTASDASKVLIVVARATLDDATLRALLDLGVSGCLAQEDTPPETLPHSLASVLAGGVVISSGLLAALLGAHERRRGGRLEGLTLTERERARERASGGTGVACWVHDPALAAGVGLHVAQAGLTLEMVDTAAALLDAAPRSAALVVDCAGVPDALDRCLAVVPRATRPVLICHPDEGFVDDLRPIAGGELTWLPPAWLGARLRDKLRLLVAPPVGALGAGPDAALPPRLTGRQRAVLALAEDGYSNRAIAARLGLSTNTVKTHLANARRTRDGDEREGTDAGVDEGDEAEGLTPPEASSRVRAATRRSPAVRRVRKNHPAG